MYSSEDFERFFQYQSKALSHVDRNRICGFREYVMSKITPDLPMNIDMVVELLRPELEVTKEDI